MAITVTLDTVEQAGFDYSYFPGITPLRFSRSCIVSGIDVSASSNKSEALWLAQEAISAAIIAVPLEAARASQVLPHQIFIEPTSDTTARGRIVYSNLIFGAGSPPSSYMIRDGGYMRSMETNRLPGTHQPIRCTWLGANYGSAGAGSGSAAAQANYISDLIRFTIPAPMRSIMISALIYGTPASAPIYGSTPLALGGQDSISLVNDAAWPTGGASGLYPHAKGYWRLDKYETSFAKYSGYYNLEAQATTKVIEDWSETGILRNTQTGRYVTVDPAKLAALLVPAYDYGIFYPGGVNDAGIVRVGFSPVVNFPGIFGF